MLVLCVGGWFIYILCLDNKAPIHNVDDQN